MPEYDRIDELEKRVLALIESNERRHTELAEAKEVALRVALENNDRRLNAMNEFRGALADQTTHMVTREEFEVVKDAGVERLDAVRRNAQERLDNELKPISDKLEQMGRPNWPLMVSIFSVLTVMIAGIWLVIGLKIEATVAPLTLSLETIRSTQVGNTALIHKIEAEADTSVQADAASRTDRAQLNQRVMVNESVIGANAGERRAEVAALRAKLIEVETQFCASDIIRNLIHAHDMREIAILWHKTMDEVMPTDNAYYPRVCNRETQANQ